VDGWQAQTSQMATSGALGPLLRVARHRAIGTVTHSGATHDLQPLYQALARTSSVPATAAHRQDEGSQTLGVQNRESKGADAPAPPPNSPAGEAAPFDLCRTT
jgi:hypothetical protein